MAYCNIEKTIMEKERRIPYSYDLALNEIGQLFSLYEKHGIVLSLIKAYIFGFIRGTRAKARNRVPEL